MDLSAICPSLPTDRARDQILLLLMTDEKPFVCVLVDLCVFLTWVSEWKAVVKVDDERGTHV